MARALVAMLKRDCNAQSVDDPRGICTNEAHRLARIALHEHEKASRQAA